MGENIAISDDQKKRQLLIDWLFPTPMDLEANHRNALSLRAPGTGQWFLNSVVFNDWLEANSSFMWLHGIRECSLNPCPAQINPFFVDEAS